MKEVREGRERGREGKVKVENEVKGKGKARGDTGGRLRETRREGKVENELDEVREGSQT